MFLAVVAAAVAAALVLVGERAAITRTGYRVAELEREQLRLVQANHRLEAAVAKLKAPMKIWARAKELGIRSEPPEDRLKKQQERQAKARAKAKAAAKAR